MILGNAVGFGGGSDIKSITLSGDISGNVSVGGSADVVITTAITDSLISKVITELPVYKGEVV